MSSDGSGYAGVKSSNEQSREDSLVAGTDFEMTHIYIASLGHSGSTILGIALGAVAQGVSIGELDATVRRVDDPQHDCTCGATAGGCPVWGPVFAAWENAGGRIPGSDDADPMAERYAWGYRRLYESLRDSGSGHIMVDTSKDPKALRSVPADPGVTLKVVFLVKDPRSYFVSHYRKWLGARGANRTRIQGRRDRKRRAPFFALELGVAALNWWWGNRRLLGILRRGGYDYLVISYEELVLDTPSVEERLSAFLRVPVSLHEIPPRPEQRHILRGNALRHSEKRSSGLRYDYRWFYDPWVRRLRFLFPPLIKWGQRRGLLPSR